MTEHNTTASAGRFEVRVTADTHFGWLRTRLSVERTMMSWIRTAVSLIGFGFAIVQFFERLQQMPGASTAYLPRGTEVSRACTDRLRYRWRLLISIWQYRWTVHYLWSGPFAPIAGMKERECNRRSSRSLSF